ncbi:unnamed protein product [Peniophora sp. CBMAI 1063]|nr:unnamed protein product [Peniophora sp. CBMAI 1063]
MSDDPRAPAHGLHVVPSRLVYESLCTDAAISKIAEPHCRLCGMQTSDADQAGRELQRCSGCKTAFYCSRSCQKQDWRRHKVECQLQQRVTIAFPDSQPSSDDWDEKTTSAHPDLPPKTVIQSMLHDFRMRGDAFPPMDINNEYVAFILTLRDHKASPASVFKFKSGLAPVPMDGMDRKGREQLEEFSTRLARNAKLEEGIKAGWYVVPVFFLLDDLDIAVTMTGVELTRSHLNPSLLMTRVPDDAPWWAQLEYNAANGLALATRWDDAMQVFIMETGTLKQHGSDWHWERVTDSGKAGVIIRNGDTLYRE